MRFFRRWRVMLAALLIVVGAMLLPGCASGAEGASVTAAEATNWQAKKTKTDEASKKVTVEEDGTYTSKEEVALYLHEYGHLPSNYVTKDEAEDAGWKSEYRTVEEACPGKSIGGDRFGNREKRLPTASGRKWYECDIDYKRGSRNAKRIVYSNDGLIYYTEDHYKTFERLY